MRASRLVSVLLLLQNRGRLTAGELAEELGVSVRTMYRDLESLVAAGVPIYAEQGPTGGYRLVDGYRTRLTGLTEPEAGSLFLAGLPGPAAQLGLGAELTAARLKLEAALSPEARARARRIRERFHLDAPSWFRPAEQTPHLTALAEAVWHQQRVRMRYQGWDPRVPAADRELDPLGVVCKAGQWYLVGGAGDRPHTYRVSRIEELTVLPDRFDRPADFELAAFWTDWARRFEAGMYRGEMVVRLAPGAFRLLAVVWNPVPAEAASRAGPPDEDGWRRAVIPIESDRHALVEVLKLGALIEVLEPAGLRATIAETAAAMLAVHR